MKTTSESSGSPTLSHFEMERVISDFGSAEAVEEQSMPWSSTEELLVARKHPVFAKAAAGATIWPRLRAVAFLLAIVSVILGPVYGAFQSTQAVRPGQKCLDKLV